MQGGRGQGAWAWAWAGAALIAAGSASQAATGPAPLAASRSGTAPVAAAAGMARLAGAIDRAQSQLDRQQPEAAVATLEPLLKATQGLAAAAGGADAAAERDYALQAARAWELLATGCERIGRFVQAREARRQGVASLAAGVGAQDRRTLDARRALALALRDLQREADAEREFRQVLADRLQSQPPDLASVATDHRLLVEQFLRPQHQLAEAESLLQKAIGWRRQVAGFRDTHLVGEWIALAGVHLDQGRAADAESMLLRLLKLAQAAVEEVGSSEQLQARVALGEVQTRQGRYAAAEQTLRQAIDQSEQAAGPRPIDLHGANLRLAEVLMFQQRLPEAETLLRAELHRLSAQLRGEFHPQLWPVQRGLGKLLIDQDRPAKAEALLRRLTAETARVRGPRHPDTALANAELARALYELRRYDESEQRLKQALQSLSQALGEQSEPVSRLRRQLADAYNGLGRFAQAASMFRADLQAVQARLGPRHPEVANAQTSLAMALLRQGQAGDTVVLLRQALAIREAQQPPVPAKVAETLNWLGEAYMDSDDLGHAEEVLLRALALRRQLATGPHDRAVIAVQSHLSGVWTLAGKFDQSEAMLREAITSAEALDPANPHQLPNLLVGQAGNFRRKGDFVGARALAERALALRQKALGPEAGQSAIIETVLARILTAMGQPQAGRERAEHAISVFDRSDNLRGTPYMARARLRLAEALRAEGRLAQARPHASLALRLLERAYGPRHDDTREARNLLASLGSAD